MPRSIDAFATLIPMPFPPKKERQPYHSRAGLELEVDPAAFLRGGVHRVDHTAAVCGFVRADERHVLAVQRIEELIERVRQRIRQRGPRLSAVGTEPLAADVELAFVDPRHAFGAR